MEYFAQVKTVQGATKRYHALAKKWHPDRNGSVEACAVMAEINRQYKEVLVSLKTEPRVRSQFADDPPIVDQDNCKMNVNDESEQVTPTEMESNHSVRSRSFGKISRNVVDFLISDSDLDSIRDKAESIVVSAATRLVSKGFSAVKRWKSQ